MKEINTKKTSGNMESVWVPIYSGVSQLAHLLQLDRSVAKKVAPVQKKDHTNLQTREQKDLADAYNDESREKAAKQFNYLLTGDGSLIDDATGPL